MLHQPLQAFIGLPDAGARRREWGAARQALLDAILPLMQIGALQMIGNCNDSRDDPTDVVEHGSQYQVIGWDDWGLSHGVSIHRVAVAIDFYIVTVFGAGEWCGR